MAAPRWLWLLPSGWRELSGGHHYNRRLIAHLERYVRLETASVAEALERPAAGVQVCVFDSLDLSYAARLRSHLPCARLVLLAHLLPSCTAASAVGAAGAFETAEREALQGGEEPVAKGAAGALEPAEREALRSVDDFVATGAFTVQHLRGLGVDARRIARVEPGCEGLGVAAPPPWPPLRALCVANLTPLKGVFELLETLSAAGQDERDDWLRQLRLDLVGRQDVDVSYAQRCLARVQQDAALRSLVRFKGPQAWADMPQVYGGAHVLVSASQIETYGMAIAEARRAGRLVAALDRGNVDEHFRAGAIGARCANLDELVHVLREWVVHPERTRRLLEQARAQASYASRSWDDAARSLLAQLRLD